MKCQASLGVGRVEAVIALVSRPSVFSGCAGSEALPSLS